MIISGVSSFHQSAAAVFGHRIPHQFFFIYLLLFSCFFPKSEEGAKISHMVGLVKHLCCSNLDLSHQPLMLAAAQST